MGANDGAYPYQQLIKDQSTAQALRHAFDAINTLRAQVKGPVRGSLNPDQKPNNLGPADAGVLFYATDFDRSYQWTGSGWVDAPGSPQRGQTAPFLTGMAPSIGWAPCNGTQVTGSTATGGTQLVQTPMLNQPSTTVTQINYASGLQIYVRL